MEINTDILYLLAEHIEPNPLTFINCALVSKAFFQVFTSDRVWRPFDLYNVGVGILDSHAEDFKYDYPQTLKRYWQGKRVYGGRKTPCSSPLAWVGFLYHRYVRYPVPHTFDRLGETICSRVVECLISLRPVYLGKGLVVIDTEEKALEAVNKCGCSLQLLGLDFRGSKTIVKAAVGSGCNRFCEVDQLDNIEHLKAPILAASTELQQDDDLMRYAIECSWQSLEKASLELRSSPKVVEIAVSQSPWALEWCKYQTREIVLEAMQRDGSALSFTEYNDDLEVVLAAMSSGGDLDQCPRPCEITRK